MLPFLPHIRSHDGILNPLYHELGKNVKQVKPNNDPSRLVSRCIIMLVRWYSPLLELEWPVKKQPLSSLQCMSLLCQHLVHLLLTQTWSLTPPHMWSLRPHPHTRVLKITPCLTGRLKTAHHKAQWISTSPQTQRLRFCSKLIFFMYILINVGSDSMREEFTYYQGSLLGLIPPR